MYLRHEGGNEVWSLGPQIKGDEDHIPECSYCITYLMLQGQGKLSFIDEHHMSTSVSLVKNINLGRSLSCFMPPSILFF